MGLLGATLRKYPFSCCITYIFFCKPQSSSAIFANNHLLNITMRKLSIILFFILTISSCHFSTDKLENNIVDAYIGTKLNVPNYPNYLIQKDTIKYDFNNADYKIVSYIDSATCIPCEMKLAMWNHILNDLTNSCDGDINFVMILNTNNIDQVQDILIRENFLYPVVFDGTNFFKRKNKMPPRKDCQTFLLR